MADEKSGRIWGFLMPKLMRMPWNDRNGNPVFLDLRRWVPAGDIVDTGQVQSAIPLPPPVVPGGPLMMMGEFFLNTSGFTGNDLVKKTDDLDERLAKSAEWLWKGVAPNFPGLPGTYTTDALVDAARGRVNPGPHGDERTSMGQAALSAVGIKVGSYPIETLDYMNKVSTNAAVREILSTLNTKVAAVKRSGMDEAEKAQEIDKLKARAKVKIEKRAAELREKREKAGLQ
jgi:hypothetical protein